MSVFDLVLAGHVILTGREVPHGFVAVRDGRGADRARRAGRHDCITLPWSVAGTWLRGRQVFDGTDTAPPGDRPFHSPGASAGPAQGIARCVTS